MRLPDDEPYRVWKLYDDTAVIHYGEALDCFLLLGKEKALLIDTAYGRGELPNIVDELAGGRELVVANTHGHFDHTGGNFFYPRVYMHPAARAYCRRSFGKLDEKWMANMPYPDYECADLEDGHVFDLGGRRVECVYTCAHSDSSVSFIDRGRRLLFCGDEFDAGQANIGGDFAKVGMFLDNCRKLRGRWDEYDFIMPNHNGCPIAKSYLDDFITCAEHILEGRPDTVPREGLPGYKMGFGEGLMRAQVGLSCINYTPEKKA